MTFDIPTIKDIEQAVSESTAKAITETVPRLLEGAHNEEWITTEELLQRTGWSSSSLHSMKNKGLLPYSQAGKGSTIHWPWHRICSEYFEANLREPEG